MKEPETIVRSEDRDLLREILGQRVLTLASISPRRRDILAECGVRFRVARPRVEEPPPEGDDPRGWTRRWALRKTLSVQRRQMNDIILSADTVVVHRGHPLGKPKDAAEAAMMLRRLSGQSHRVITGFAVVADWGRKQLTGSEESVVRFRKLTDREIDAYVGSGEPMDKAGAYAIQGHAREFVTDIEGPLDNIVGLPVRRVAQVINRVIHGSAKK
ncbi:MAG: Maf family protein [Candidatus Zixiibacteriota bacterium]